MSGIALDTLSLLQQLKDVLRKRIRLCQHRRPGLLQNARPCHIGCFLREVGIHDS